jgi:anti-anti-sigma regulatory factor
MSVKATGSTSNSGHHRYGNPMVDCNGAQIHKQCRQLATVLVVTGVIDDGNIDAITAHAKSCIIPEKPFILDLSGVTSFAGHDITLFDVIDEACGALGEEWSLIASQPVSRTLRLCGIEGSVPSASSVPAALHHFSDVAGERRQLLPILIKSA